VPRRATRPAPFLTAHPLLGAEMVLGGVVSGLLPTVLHAGTVVGWTLLVLVAAVMVYLPVRLIRRWLPEMGELFPRMLDVYRDMRANVHRGGSDG
jgi:hypothetical protein